MASDALKDHEKASINTEQGRLHLQRIRALATFKSNLRNIALLERELVLRLDL